MTKQKQPEKSTSKPAKTGLTELEEQLLSWGAKKVPHPGGTRARVFPEPKPHRKDRDQKKEHFQRIMSLLHRKGTEPRGLYLVI